MSLSIAWLVLIVADLVRTEIFYNRVKLDFKPVLEHRKGPIRGPCRFISVPPLEFALKDFNVDALKNFPRFIIVLELWYQVNGLFVFRIGDDP